MIQYVDGLHYKDVIYRAWENAGGGKIHKFGELWTICQFTNYFHFRNTGEYFIKVKNFKINKMAGLLKYFKCTQKKDKLDNGTLPDPHGPRQGYSFLFYWDHKYPHVPSTTGSQSCRAGPLMFLQGNIFLQHKHLWKMCVPIFMGAYTVSNDAL